MMMPGIWILTARLIDRYDINSYFHFQQWTVRRRSSFFRTAKDNRSFGFEVCGMSNKELLLLEKELDRLRQPPPGSELAAVLNELAYTTLHSDPHRSEAFAHEALDIRKDRGDRQHERSCQYMQLHRRDILCPGTL